MIDLTPLLKQLGPIETADSATDDAAGDAGLSIPQRIEELDATVDEHDDELEALMAYLGLVWCPDCANVHQPDSHTLNAGVNGSSSGLPGVAPVGPGSMAM